VGLYAHENTYSEEWDLRGLSEALYRQFGVDFAVPPEALQELTFGALRAEVWEKVREAYERREQELGADLMRVLEREVMLRVVDAQWKDHLLAMDHLKEGIGLRGYGQRDPLVEYKREGFEIFDAMVDRIKEQGVLYLYRLQPVVSEAESSAEAAGDGQTPPRIRREALRPVPKPSLRPSPPPAVAAKAGKIGRNESCPCGSGKKYKKCCGA
jgi:preprotein translocase subunit SecA